MFACIVKRVLWTYVVICLQVGNEFSEFRGNIQCLNFHLRFSQKWFFPHFINLGKIQLQNGLSVLHKIWHMCCKVCEPYLEIFPIIFSLPVWRYQVAMETHHAQILRVNRKMLIKSTILHPASQK